MRAKAHLTSALDLLQDCATTYNRAPAHIKKLLNQAFFDRILINPEVPTEPREGAVQAVEQLSPYLDKILAAQRACNASQGQTCEEPPETGRLNHQGDTDEARLCTLHAKGFRPDTLVECSGLEPLASTMRMSRSTR